MELLRFTASTVIFNPLNLLLKKVNLNFFYPHYLHIVDPKLMTKLVVKGDMDITFAGIVDIGGCRCFIGISLSLASR